MHFSLHAWATASAVAILATPVHAISVNLVKTLNLPTGFTVRDIDMQGSTALIGGDGSALVYDLGANAVSETLLPFDGAPGLRFGSSVALDGPRYIVGAPGYTFANPEAVGAAYLYDTTGPFTARRLDPSMPLRTFGESVDIDGDRAVVGGIRPVGGGPFDTSGAAFVYDAATGVEERRITVPAGPVPPFGPFPGEGFGEVVAIGDGVVAVGNRRGQTFLFGAATGSLLRATEGSFYFSSDIEIDGTTVIAGNAEAGFGVASLIDVATGTETELPWIEDNDVLDSGFGYRVAIDGGLAAVSDPEGCDIPGTDAQHENSPRYCGDANGLVGLYRTADATFLLRVESPDFPLEHEQFGRTLALSGRTLLVGNALGQIYRYRIVDDFAPVPLPAGLPLLLLGLGGLVALRWRG